MSSEPTWMLYGANGYTGRLIAEEAKRRGMRPILAGRHDEAIAPIAERLGFERRIFALDDPERIARELGGVKAVLLCAGPFSATSAPMVEACLRAKAHYLDITGEIPVFEACQRRGAEAQARGCTLLPGVGFDVVPSDCLAASLKEALPDAVSLELAFASASGVSQGTAKTVLEGIAKGGAVRENGAIRGVPFFSRDTVIPFRDRPRYAVSIPWGDVATAYYSTGIPNIVVYVAAPKGAARALRLARPLFPLLGRSFAQRLLKGLVERSVKGPDEQTRRQGRSQLWGRVTNANGRSVEGTLETPEGYALTVQTALECTRRVLAGQARPGTLTPSMAFGPRYIGEFEGCDLRIATR